MNFFTQKHPSSLTSVKMVIYYFSCCVEKIFEKWILDGNKDFSEFPCKFFITFCTFVEKFIVPHLWLELFLFLSLWRLQPVSKNRNRPFWSVVKCFNSFSEDVSSLRSLESSRCSKNMHSHVWLKWLKTGRCLEGSELESKKE